MAFIENKEELKKHFIKGDLPTEEHFANLIDAFVHKRHEKNDNIGFGTDNPNNTLDINGNMVIGSQYAGQEIAPDDGLLVEGEVGIGVDAPKEKLHVEGNIRIDNGGLMLGDQTIITHDRKWLGDIAGLQGDQGPQGPQGDSGTSSWNDSSGKVTTSVKVGIGKLASTPKTTLDVDGYVTKQQVGFTVENAESIDTNTGKIKFKSVLSNVSKKWDENTSEFVAPESGMYFFSASVIVSDNVNGTIKLLVQGESKIIIWDSLFRTNIGSTSLVIPLERNDKIALKATVESGNSEANGPNDTPVKTEFSNLISSINFSGYRL